MDLIVAPIAPSQEGLALQTKVTRNAASLGPKNKRLTLAPAKELNEGSRIFAMQQPNGLLCKGFVACLRLGFIQDNFQCIPCFLRRVAIKAVTVGDLLVAFSQTARESK
jgi:hypothetical protein